jgi:RNA recognition motif-containing protein
MRLYVGNLSFQTTSQDLQDYFSQAGTVESANVVEDRETGRSRGFGFVEMDVDNVAEVIQATNGREVDGRELRVNEAEDKGFGGGPRRDNRGPRY